MLSKGKITSLEIVEAYISQINLKEEEVQAWQHLDFEYVRQQAKNSDAKRASGVPVGILHGIPVGIKDIFDTVDFPTENGTVLSAGRRPEEDCTAVKLLKSSGAIIMGKTVTAELAVFAPGKTRNPHDLKRTPGGSSSGSAAAVAARMVPLAIGSQTNGSVIRPASFCGIYGFKPTYGKISRSGVLQLSRILDHIGVFARTIEDIALITECLMSYDPDDPDSIPTSTPTNLTKIFNQDPPTEPKFAFVKSSVWGYAEKDTQKAFEEISNFLGIQCEEIKLPSEFSKIIGNLRKIMNADLARFLSEYIQRGEEKISEILRGLIKEGISVSAIDYNNSVEQIRPMADWILNLSDEYDAIITPAACGEAPIGLESTGDPIFCSTWTYLGVPAISLPLLESKNRLPIGLQLVGPRGEDATLLRSANWLINRVSNTN
jgi:Asp-tRNA(Asn)/Glu-tRNA(Gln) amidotransferase A subunit family amidase